MRDYYFDALMGTVYRQGNILFHGTGDYLLSPVGNRVTQFDLKKNETKTLSVEGSHNYTAMDLSPNGKLLVAGNEIGEVHVISLFNATLLHILKLSDRASVIKFSPDGSMFAVAKGDTVFIYNAPGLTKSFNPTDMRRVYHNAEGDVTCVDWSFDSKLILIGAKDRITRIYSLEKYANFKPAALANQTDVIISAFFMKDSYSLYTVSRNKDIVEWSCSHEPEEFILGIETKPKQTTEADSDDDFGVNANQKKDSSANERYFIKAREDLEGSASTNQPTLVRFTKHEKQNLYSSSSDDKSKPHNDYRISLTCADYNKTTNLLVTGYSDGAFIIHLLPNFDRIQSLSITEHVISTVRINSRGDWIAFGSPTLGQLLVWEWESETYVLKQQGHLNTMLVCAFSPDGRNIVTGGQDGKVKLWETRSSFCFVTFTEHTSSVTGVVFTATSNAVLSSSLDGTVRAFDLGRYRNFRTFTSTKPAQFSCVTVDSSGEFVAAGANDVFEIFLWSMKTGKLLEMFGGHEGPVTSVLFSPSIGSTQLISTSLDKTLRMWETIENSGVREISQLNSEGICLAYKPDGQECVVGTLDCHILIFKSRNFEQRATIEGRNHLGSGRSDADKITAKKNLAAKAFTSLSYSPDGVYLLAAGMSKNICYYDSTRGMLLKKFQITQNKSLDGMNEFIHHKNLTEFGNLESFDNEDSVDKLSLPGVRMGDMSSRKVKPEVRVTSLCFSPAGMQWIATSTEGLFMFNHDNSRMFLPFGADENVTPETIQSALREGVYDKALLFSLLLNVEDQTRQVLQRIPESHIPSVCRSISPEYRELFLQFVAAEIGKSPHLQRLVLWAETFLKTHLSAMKSQNTSLLPGLNMLEKNMVDKQKDLMSLADRNKYMIRYFLGTAGNKQNGSIDGLMMEMKKDEPMEVAEVSDHDSDSSSDDDDLGMGIIS